MRKLGEYLVKYQDPLQADSLTRLQADVEDTTRILVSRFFVDLKHFLLFGISTRQKPLI